MITFGVPTESTSAGTVGLKVTLPTDRPITSARTEPASGWTAKVVRGPLPPPVPVGEGGTVTQAVREIIWTAAPGVRIGPTEFAEFRVSAGPLPSTPGPLVMPATQTYDDGKVVAWTEPPGPPGSPEPEHPPPTVMVVPADSGATPTTNSDGAATWLGGAGLVLGAIGAVLGTVALLRTRRSGAGGPQN